MRYDDSFRFLYWASNEESKRVVVPNGINIIFKPLPSLEAVLLFHILISSHYSDSMVKILFVANIVEEEKEKFDGIIPAQNARTRRFTVGAPRSFSLSADGDWITFLQSNSSEDPLNKLWAWSASSGQTKVIADLEALINSGNSETISREELARRERVREIGAGIVSYSANGRSPNIAFASNQSLFKVGIESSEVSNFNLGRDILTRK